MSNNSFFKNHMGLILTLIIYSLLSIFLFKYYQYPINSDGISYICIAQNYLTGDFLNAVNGYWGPLLSWLLIPFLFFGSTPSFAVHSIHIMSLIIGFFTIIGVKFLSNNFEMDEKVRSLILFTMIPLTFYFSFSITTPDLLVTCVLIYYLGIIFNPKYPYKLFNGVLCGFLGALAYLGKSYVLVFFIAHFLLFNLFYYFQGVTKAQKRNVLKNLVMGLTVFLMISGLWIGLISDKYGELTIGTSGAYNQAIAGPESLGQPMLYQGLIKPPNESALSIWEDPSYLKMKNWNPLESWKSFKYQLNLIWGNIIRTANIFDSFSVLALLIILASIIFVIKGRNEKVPKWNLIYLLVTILIYSGGYALILVEARYLWLIYVLLLLTGAYLLEMLFKVDVFNNKMKNILLTLLIFSFIIMPTLELVQNVNAYENTYELSKTLQTDYNIHGNIASNDNWEISIFLAYYSNSKYYGITKKMDGVNGLQDELKANNIDYYLVWGDSNNIQLSNYTEINDGKIKNLRIYKRII